MSADQIRRDLERKIRAREDAEKDAGKHRTKAATASSDAAKLRNDAGKKSPTIARQKLRDAERRDDAAAKANRDAATAETKVARLRSDEQRLRTRLSAAEKSEGAAAERKQKAEQKRLEKDRSAERAAYERRIAAAEARAEQAHSVAQTAARKIPAPKPEKLRVLMLGADSEGAEEGQSGLRIGREQQRIAKAVRMALHRDSIELDPRPAATPDDVLDGITRFRPHVVHFSGHSNEDILAFEQDDDSPNSGVMVAGDVFARAMRATDDPPVLVVLNSCNSASHLDAIVDQVAPFAIGMTDEIGDRDAIAYAAQFYASIANGQSIGAAHRAGVVVLEMSGLDSDDLPVLQAGSQLDPDQVVLVIGT